MDKSYTITATDATGIVVTQQTFAESSVQGFAGLRFAESWVKTGQPIIDAGGMVTITKAIKAVK